MKAELISIGSELTTGRNLDTNAQWLSRRLAEIGIPVGFHTTVADDLTDNLDVFRTALRRAQLVLTTGGIGPTLDDLTREVAATVAGVDLFEDAASLEHIQQMFARRNRVMPERNRVQAQFPVGSEPVRNEKGTAPGIWMKIGESFLGCMPGVPSEMFHMFETQIKPRILAQFPTSGVILERKINTFGMGESAVEEKVSDLTARGHVPEVGITASDAVIGLRIFANGPTRDAALAQAAPIEATIRERLGELVFGIDDDTLQLAVIRLLNRHRKSLSVAEGVTGGMVAHLLATVPGASSWFRGGLIAYDDTLKVQLLGVPSDLIAMHGTVSPEVVTRMAEGCRARVGTDLAIATVGVAGPDGGSEQKPVGMVYAALASADAPTVVQQFSWTGTRHEVQSRTSKLALNLVRLHLQRKP
ncbi:competence/damage-inducible protein A [Tuwongella immobilis]|uniref:CinA-like protein n=1 Tax=Tuwongella immobilis TaxID=692036 RepID=A0A6C2YMQ6_9BACT|nr:competence/damage-inducible protein A [Tuwongella immobilis]VIP02202.1 CinA-like protein OS=Singulisphaera acidiphila (strain ATCC BAA-1392 / DSM 18658 / VKM B-2454 / MOB10) GN=Sinac_1552 PE=3 SV=1: MoCF_biosynth: CinA [Tuwongella immobilis]VTS00693.1 CinA-like protein OS=Singulisphaera acidiphila (strain ATCC BAA-1392 / DSM 18658 / VKM B-2454 / MOB10) GN=Sinac_1552 PE=3 SV=1: MoCF_biosynth: CinA [Tuwongella immobilis]